MENGYESAKWKWKKKVRKMTWNSERRRSWRDERAGGWVWGNRRTHRRRRRWEKKACSGGIGISASADGFEECSPTFPPFPNREIQFVSFSIFLFDDLCMYLMQCQMLNAIIRTDFAS